MSKNVMEIRIIRGGERTPGSEARDTLKVIDGSKGNGQTLEERCKAKNITLGRYLFWKEKYE